MCGETRLFTFSLFNRDFTLTMLQMAVKNSQINVALRLLSTVIKGSLEVCAIREKTRNLLHVLALHANPDRDQHEQEKVKNKGCRTCLLSTVMSWL